MKPGTLVRLIDGRIGVVGATRSFNALNGHQREVWFKLRRHVTTEIAEVLEPATYPHGEGNGKYPDVVEFVRQTDARVTAGR